ncbi:MAG: translation elongation factor Ts [Candidatus Pelagibacter sp.]
MSDLESVKKLRSTTGAGFKDCNSALKEASGNLEKAIEILRIKGVSKASKKMSREANEGLIFICGDEKKTSIIEINCETDFVAKNDDFLNFTKEIGEINNSVNSDLEKLKNSKMKNGSSVSQNLIDLIAKIGEKITIGRSKTFENSKSKIFTYSHSIVKDNLSKLGVVVSLEFEKTSKEIEQFGKQISMHIAASNPMAIEKKDIKDDIIKKEKEIIKEELKNLGKPQEIAEKISLGKINKFTEDNSLLTQDWVMDPKLKVKDVLDKVNSNNLKIKDFIRIKIGE